MSNNCSILMKESLDSFLGIKGDSNAVPVILSSAGLAAASNVDLEANTNIDSSIIAPKQASIETSKQQKAIPEDKYDLASILSNVPEEVKPSDYKDTSGGIKNYIAKIESRGFKNPYEAKNPISSAKGKYQFTDEMAKELSTKLSGVTKETLKNPDVQEKAMDYLIGEYKDNLAKWNLPVTKENIFILHNLGITGGIRTLRGNYEPIDIKHMANNLKTGMDKSSRNAVISNYSTLYNVDIPIKRSV